MITSVFRKAQFNAAHRLHVKEWDDQKNSEFFGPCNNPNYHGHNYELHVKITGEVDSVTGYLFDLGKLKQIIQEEVISRFDHKNLNLDVEDFRELNPSAENIAFVIWQLMRKRIEPKYDLSVRLYETPRNYIEYDGH